MKNIEHFFRFAIIILVLFFLNSCEEPQQDDIFKQLEVKGKIATFPLTIVLTSNLPGDNFPDDLKSFVAVSPGPCKTLPVAGILRLGPDQYYTYNNVSTLKLSPDDKDEKSVTTAVIGQVNDYLSKTTLKDFDSLRAPILSELSAQILSTDYLRTTTDSVFFYSALPNASNLTVMGGRSFPVYKDAAALRNKIDEMICRKQATISIIYTASSTPGLLPGGGLAAPAKGMYAGDTCIGTSKFEKLNDGKGNLFVGKLLEENSKSCGFSFPTGIAGDTCIGRSRYRRLHNGRGGYTLGPLVEKNSSACGYSFPTGLAGDTCSNGSKYQKMHDGKGGFVLGNIIEKNSRSCGFRAPAIIAPVPAATLAKPVTTNQPINKSANNPLATKPVTSKVVIRPADKPVTNTTVTPSTPTARPVQARPVPTTRSTPKTEDLPDAGIPPASTGTDKRCVKTSEALCEQDAGGNYTGRRIQYCYNAAGKIVKTIVLSKCDSDCRCLGK